MENTIKAKTHSRKEEFGLLSDHNGSLLRQQPAADTQQTCMLCFTNCRLAAQFSNLGELVQGGVPGMHT